MKNFKRLVGFSCVGATLFVFAGCGGSLQSRTARMDVSGKSYDAQMKGTGGAISDDISFVVNNTVLGQGSISPLSGAVTLSGYLDKILFESECTVETTANGWGKLRHCKLFADKKSEGEVAF